MQHLIYYPKQASFNQPKANNTKFTLHYLYNHPCKCLSCIHCSCLKKVFTKHLLGCYSCHLYQAPLRVFCYIHRVLQLHPWGVEDILKENGNGLFSLSYSQSHFHRTISNIISLTQRTYKKHGYVIVIHTFSIINSSYLLWFSVCIYNVTNKHEFRLWVSF